MNDMSLGTLVVNQTFLYLCNPKEREVTAIIPSSRDNGARLTGHTHNGKFISYLHPNRLFTTLDTAMAYERQYHADNVLFKEVR